MGCQQHADFLSCTEEISFIKVRMANSSPIDLANTLCVFDKLLEPVIHFVQKQHKQIPQHHNQKLDYITFF